MGDDRLIEPRKASPDHVQTRGQLADELTALRMRAGLTVRDISRAIDQLQPHSTIGEWFAGRSVPSNSSQALYVEVLRACGVTSDEEIERWLDARRRVRQLPGPKGGTTPYRGLMAFQPEDAEWFFGREALSEHIVEQVINRHADGGGLQTVVGASGSGKSSLLRAGVIPALSIDAAPGRPAWPVVLMTPGGTPVDQLASALAAGTRVSADAVADRIRSDPATGLAEQIATFISAARTVSPARGVPVPAADRLLIVVDQLEELFTLCADETERRTFVTALDAAAHSPVPRHEPDLAAPIATVVVLGLRADFYPQALRYPEIAAALQSAQFTVGPLTEDELRRVIAEPATNANLQLDEGLVELLIRDVAAGSAAMGAVVAPTSALPLLSHALLSTWQRSERGRMTTRGYLATGGIRGAVAATAEAVYDDLTASQQVLARRVFLRLVNLGDDATLSRRTVVRADLEGADDLIEHFAAARLLTLGTDTVEISHEALITAWPRLHDWIDSDRDGLRRHRQLADAAVQWRDLDRDPGSLYRGGRLHGVRDWATPTTDDPATADPAKDDRAKGDPVKGEPAIGRDLNALETEFLAASLAAERAEQQQSRHRTRRLQELIAALTALALVAAGLAGYAFWKRRTADRERDLAMSRQVAMTADRLRATDPGLAARLSLAAYRIAATVEARSSLLDATGSPAVTRIVRPSKGAQSVVLSPDGRTLYAAGTGPSDTRVLTWDLSDRVRPRRVGPALTAHSLPVFGTAVSPDGRLLATGGRDQTVRLWDVSDPARPAGLGVLPGGPAGTVYSLAFAPDGRTLAAGSSGRMVRLWNLDDPAEPVVLTTLPALNGYAQSVAFDESGLLAAGDATGTLYLWDVADRARPRLLSRTQTGSQQINVVSFVPQQRKLMIGGTKGLFQQWDVSRPEAPAQLLSQLTVPDNWVNSVAVSPDGHRVAIGSSDNVAQVWDVSDGAQLIATLPHPEPVSSVAFTDGGRTVVTAGSDGVARLWSIPGPVITGPTATVATTAFSPDGRSLAAFGGAAFLVNVTQPRAPVAWAGGLTSPLPDEPLAGAGAVSPDGKLLAAGTTVDKVLLWDISDPARAKALGPPLTGPAAVVESLTFIPDSTVLIAGADDGKIHLWDVADPGRVTAVPVAAGADSNYVYMVAVSPDGATLAGVTADGVIRLWDLHDPRRPRELPSVKGSADLLFSTAFSRDGKVLATGSADGTVQLWDVSNPAELKPIGAGLQGPDGTVTAVAFGPDGRTLAASTRSGQVWFWDVGAPERPATVAILSASKAAVWAVGFGPDGHTVVTGGSDRTVRLWETDPARAADVICAAGGDPVSADEWSKYLPGVPYEPVC